MKKYLFLILTIVITGCSGIKNPVALPQLTIENRKANKLIVNRKPDYGNGHRDGCIVMGEISMDIERLNEKGISGKVFDSKTKDPLAGAKLTLFVNQNGLIKKTIISSNAGGFFKGELNAKPTKIKVEFPGYRDLIIDLGKR